MHCRMEEDETEEAIQALRNLVLLIGSLTTCGFVELRQNMAVASNTVFNLPGFKIPIPSGKGEFDT